MPTSARTSLGFFGQFADVGIRAPEQNGLLQQTLTKQPFPQPCQSPGAMAYFVFHLRAQLGERFFMAFRNEEWIVAKTALPSGRKADPAIALALE